MLSLLLVVVCCIPCCYWCCVASLSFSGGVLRPLLLAVLGHGGSRYNTRKIVHKFPFNRRGNDNSDLEQTNRSSAMTHCHVTNQRNKQGTKNSPQTLTYIGKVNKKTKQKKQNSQNDQKDLAAKTDRTQDTLPERETRAIRLHTDGHHSRFS